MDKVSKRGIDALIKLLDDEKPLGGNSLNRERRCLAASILGDLGPDAKSALRKLRTLRTKILTELDKKIGCSDFPARQKRMNARRTLRQVRDANKKIQA